MNIKFLSFLGIIMVVLSVVGCTVPQPAEENTTVIEGKLVAVTTCCDGGDVQFELDGYESLFYLNRAIEAGFDLEAFEAEVAVGDTVFIRAFDKFLREDPTDKALLGIVPAAEIATEEKVFYSTMPELE